MATLVLVDGVGGSLSTLAAAMARVEGAPGFDAVVARSATEVTIDPVVTGVLAEVGVNLPPVAKPWKAGLAEGDVVVAIGDDTPPEVTIQWSIELAGNEEPELVKRATARIARDKLAREVARLCASRRD